MLFRSYKGWANENHTRSLVIIRPTVVFGEGNRGNVYNLLRQIATGRFMMVGPGTNRKSMAYVRNVADALVFSLTLGSGIHVFNYADMPDLTMNEMVALVNRKLSRTTSSNLHIPMPFAMAGGHILDLVARLTGRILPVSAIRVKKFCQSTQVSAAHCLQLGFTPRYSLMEGLAHTIQSEFLSRS